MNLPTSYSPIKCQMGLWTLSLNSLSCEYNLDTWTTTPISTSGPYTSPTVNNKITYGVHLKIDQLASCQGNYYLSLVHCTFHNCFLSRGLPLIDSLVCSDVPNAIRIHLE